MLSLIELFGSGSISAASLSIPIASACKPPNPSRNALFLSNSRSILFCAW
ncbi:Vmc-like lipoprotein signal peptide domain-containing protein [Adhaeribacter terreus]|uniref:Vmc-like lipoprotein signal peptide domain-containing protein n=1 Tax=Adhaeribacter terreus TaxID=529703 RepID=A0ABW0E7E5_9BACT